MKLTDSQLVLLSRAAERGDHGLEFPEKLKGGAAQKVAAKLIRDGLAEEVTTGPAMPVWREDPDQGAISLVITHAGFRALGIEPSEGQEADPPDAPGQNASEKDPDGSDERMAAEQPPREGTKLAAVVGLLQRDTGATIGDLTAATGWLPHTARAALTGLRKRGYAITRGDAGEGQTSYRTPAATSAGAAFAGRAET